jgi:hypothetical protein
MLAQSFPAETGMDLMNIVAVVTMLLLVVMVVPQGQMGMAKMGFRHLQGAGAGLTEDLQAPAALGVITV